VGVGGERVDIQLKAPTKASAGNRNRRVSSYYSDECAAHSNNGTPAFLRVRV
jgi:hypothetical protein